MRRRVRSARFALDLAPLALAIGLALSASATHAQQGEEVCPSRAETTVIDLINDERAKQGLPPYALDVRLVGSARGHSADMATNGFFSHTGSDGSTFAQREQREGYPMPGGENIAGGYPTPAAAVEAWMNSSGHRALILETGFTQIGVGYAAGGPYGHYWTANFGRSIAEPVLGPCVGAPGAPTSTASRP